RAGPAARPTSPAPLAAAAARKLSSTRSMPASAVGSGTRSHNLSALLRWWRASDGASTPPPPAAPRGGAGPPPPKPGRFARGGGGLGWAQPPLGLLGRTPRRGQRARH